MSYWNSRGLRGSALEETINFTNDWYRRKGLALLQKIPTPITPIEVDHAAHAIKRAYFEKQSTVDYIGAVQGIPICFDAKETGAKHLPLQNIHPHQIQFMEDFAAQGGIAFLLVHFTVWDTYFFLPLEVLCDYCRKAAQGGRKSIPYSAFCERYRITELSNGTLDYLSAVDKYLQDRSRERKTAQGEN